MKTRRGRKGGRSKRRKGRPLRVALGAALLAALCYATFTWWSWPDVGRLLRNNPKTTAFIEAWRSEMRSEGRLDAPDWRWVPYDAISSNLKRAVLVGEDVNFFSHHGFEVAEMKKALEDAWEDKDLPRGASTVTQQLAKNLWLSPSYNPLRKLKEALLTRELESRLDKRRILEIYLNVVEFGPGVYGAEAASRRYFGKPATDLTEAEAARLAASLPNPTGWNPSARSPKAEKRAQKLLRRMDHATFLSREVER